MFEGAREGRGATAVVHEAVIEYLTEHFISWEPENQEIVELYVAQNCRSTYFEALKC